MSLARRTLILAGLAVAAVSGCSAKPKVDLLAGTAAYVAQEPDHPLGKTAAVASQQIGWHLLAQGDPTKNQVLSPASLCSSLALVGLGATGTSATGLDELFGMTGEDRAVGVSALRAGLAGYASLPASIDAKNPPEKPVINLASRLLICSDMQPASPFLDSIRKYFDAAAEKVEPSEAQASLDAWAKKNTAGLIEKSGIELTPETKLVVQDALLFAARWENEFTSDDAALTFTTGSGSTVELKALSDSFSIRTASGPGWQAVRLPYDDNLAMDVLLPERGTHPLTWDAQLLQETHEKLSAASKAEVEVTMPPVDLTAKLDLTKQLALLGVDLSHLDGIADGAQADQVVQQVRLQVNAKGAVGAALTEAVVETSGRAEPPIEFIVDRPYAIRMLDVRTGWPLFLAVVSNPEEK
jgi:putative serpin (serine proteinase inhibitor) family protein